jgi:hypothetical protein
MPPKPSIRVAALLLAAFLLPSTLFAGARRFTYIYEVTTTPPKEIESENWVTWQTSKPADSRFNQVDFRHEIEVGVTDRFQAAVYVADWGWKNDPAENAHGFRYQDSGIELIYNLSHPVADLLGSAVYGEFRLGDEFMELEGKLLLQKNIGRWVFAYNAIVEAEWEGSHFQEKNGELSQVLGVSYEFSPKFLVGAELVHEVDIPDWSHAGNSPVWLGPNASYRHGDWWVTVTPLFQLTRLSDEPDFQLRAIFGVSF